MESLLLTVACFHHHHPFHFSLVYVGPYTSSQIPWDIHCISVFPVHDVVRQVLVRRQVMCSLH